MNPYGYPVTEPCFDLKLEGTTRSWWHYTVSFATAFNTGYKESSIARAEYFRPRRQDSAPLAILLHGIGDRSLIPCKLLARALVKKGIACLVLYLVVHSIRMPGIVRRRFPILTPDEWFETYQTSVIEVRQMIDWASSRDEIDKGKTAVIGISLGGFISAIAMGIDERIRAGVFIVAGGNGEKINHKSRLSAITKSYRRSEAEYQHIQQSYLHYLAEVTENGFEAVTPPSESFLTDPMTFAYRLRHRPILMINARWDEAIPREAILDFWHALGKPAIMWFPTTHATIWLWYPFIRGRIIHFLGSAFPD